MTSKHTPGPWTALRLVRSDAGDGGWSLHLDATDHAIAAGDAPALTSGPSDWDSDTGEWVRPDAGDYAAALAKAGKVQA